MVDMIRVISSNVAAVGYDDISCVLVVRFHDGARVYSYRGVPRSVYRAFLAAPSKGQFLAWLVKGQYPYARVA